MKFFTIIGLASAAKLTQKVAQRDTPLPGGTVGGYNGDAYNLEATYDACYDAAGDWNYICDTTGGTGSSTGAAMQDDWSPEMQGNNWEDTTAGDYHAPEDINYWLDNSDQTGWDVTGGADDACYDAAGDWNYICDTTGGTDGASTGAAMQDDWSPEMQGNNWEDKDNTGWSVTGGDNGMDHNEGMPGDMKQHQFMQNMENVFDDMDPITHDDIADMLSVDMHHHGAPVATGGQWTDEEVAEFLEDDTMGDHTDDNQWADDFQWEHDDTFAGFDEGWESDNQWPTDTAAGEYGDNQWATTTSAGGNDYGDYTTGVTGELGDYAEGFADGFDAGYDAATADPGLDGPCADGTYACV